MIIKVSDFIASFLDKHNLNTVFTITGGFSMHLSDSFYKNKNFKNFYQLHEQACAYSAIGYAKSTNNIPIVCTTAGVAVINSLSSCLVAFQDSVSLLILAGQVKSTESIRRLREDQGLHLRHYAGADSDIVSMAKTCTKYCEEIDSIEKVIPCMHKAIENLLFGRPGPVLLSISIDIQGMMINIDDTMFQLYGPKINLSYNVQDLQNIYELLQQSKKPIIIAGNGIKLGKCSEKFETFLNKYKIPVVTTMMSTDIIQDNNDLYIGRIGILGQRAGNFTIQNSDLVLSLGCRMAQGLIGYRKEWFARNAKIIHIDLDKTELEKTNLEYSLKIHMDLNFFFDHFSPDGIENTEWNKKCLYWKHKWYQEMPPLLDISILNPYPVLKRFFEMASDNKIITCSSGSIVVVAWHTAIIKSNDQFIISSQGDMGFELPAAIGAQIANPDKTIISILGEGSFQLHIQELQTIVHHKLPIKILLFNNGGYGSIIITQHAFFKSKYGCDSESDLSFPDHEKIAFAYGIKYVSLKNYNDVETKFIEFFETQEAIILEIFCCVQARVPKLSAFKNDDGTFTNRPFEDMEPFMSREEICKEMTIDMV
jgi:acetolactate synthase-1/2/3 large subunit